jgi:SAM-dependent methyltransferase
MTLRKIYDVPSQWGDRIGADWLTYNPGVYLEFALVARRNAPLFGATLLDVFPNVKSIVDVGCGTGQFCAYFTSRGVRAVGFEYSRMARAWARLIGVDVHPFDLSSAPPPHPVGRADVALSLEVGEHIPATYAARFVEMLASIAPIVVLTCAPPGQAGNGHINCQPKSYWTELFRARGFTRSAFLEGRMVEGLERHPRVSPFLATNLMVFQEISA